VLSGHRATTTPSGKLVFGFFAALAEFERELIIERTKAALCLVQLGSKYNPRSSRAPCEEQKKGSGSGAGRHSAGVQHEQNDAAASALMAHTHPVTLIYAPGAIARRRPAALRHGCEVHSVRDLEH
jgi:Resolvase, N terminal domain